MNVKYSKFLLVTGTLFLFFAAANAQTKPVDKFPVVPVHGSELRTMKSADTGREYDLYIHRPASCPPEKKCAAIFVLDGQWDFKLMDSVYGGLYYDRFVPEMIIVGITYSGENPDYGALRAMDMTPTARKDVPGSGDAPKFLSFLKKDVIPFVEKNYHTDPARRVLLGNSYGGLFTLYAMFADPGLFMGYMAGAPAVSYDNNFSFTQEKNFFAAHRELPVKLYIFVGGIELLAEPVKNFIQVINSRSYTGLKMETRVIEGERHAGNKPEGFNRGLRFIFSN